jgi:NAD(P)-dependent dehydrogenase (short-subunit alcohol dehydrogenase family)
MKLKDKAAVITGSTRGIGEACAKLFAREGARVVVSGRNTDDGHRVVADIKVGGGEAVFIPCDVSISQQVRDLIDQTAAVFGRIDILMNNAAVENVKTVLDTSEEEFDYIVTTNLKAVFIGTQQVIPYMQKQGGGVIINTGSTFGHVGSPGYAVYHATKGAVLSFTRATAISYIKDKIRVNTLSPGTIDTPGLRDGVKATAKDPQAAMASYLALQPMGRFGTPDEIATGALFLASDESSFMTGADLLIDGGYIHV